MANAETKVVNDDSPAGESSTIAAPATSVGRAAIGIIRISGPGARKIALRLTQKPCPAPRQMARRDLYDPRTHEVIDDSLIVFFPGPHSATGEDLLEIHHHGSRVIASRLLDILCEYSAVRMAEPGEFTRRSFLNGKLDLTAAEGLADLIEATTIAQDRQARRQFEGRLGVVYEGWRQTLLHALSLIEAEIDFAPEEEVPDDLFAASRVELLRVRLAMSAHLNDQQLGQRLRDGVIVAITGAPNVGKSSLINTLAKREISIVTPHPGTTRDIVEVSLDLDGMPVTLLDTAGLRATKDDIEREGIARARARAAEADLVIDLHEAPASALDPSLPQNQHDRQLTIINKIDLAPFDRGSGMIGISCQTGEGIDQLIKHLAAEVRTLLPSGDAPLITRTRHREAIRLAESALSSALERRDVQSLDLAAEDLRIAVRAIGKLTGHIGVEEILGEIFSSFCIGK
ncbi:MAG: tRNA uridine-5-carboxymethylaminomethyl(34) synthesis GTPase MnmE [Pseudomonadota bacterium]